MKFNLNLMILLALMLTANFGCSKGSNPVEFSRVESKNTESDEISGEAVSETINPNYTLLELYLHEIIDRNYMMNWFFKDVSIFREKLFYIKYEIENKKPLSSHDENRVIFLENGMNEAIAKFNSKNAIKRTFRITGAAVDTRRDPANRNTKYSLNEIAQEGAPAGAISNSLSGFLNAIVLNGFKMQEVDFLDRKCTDCESSTHK